MLSQFLDSFFLILDNFGSNFVLDSGSGELWIFISIFSFYENYVELPGSTPYALHMHNMNGSSRLGSI